ncbi:hypothetical protein P8625_00115 [Tenacibaculum tangerinum]|uniref:Uncharacterized protein n=1 Tax=Tenacibaculum tangerinum TaxID=3038772 RepID=A0ABY8L3D6_9FLAO|nr:hypothetical protein [Tenacibaculum tangerinum]WGH75601.1 hypothetical protein P8625_00115 [Tenacibaculum tangerinum]
MKKGIVVMILLLNGYVAVAQTNKKLNSYNHFIFKKSMQISQEGLSNFQQKQDSLIDSEYPLGEKDSLINKKLKSLNLINIFKKTSDIEIHVEYTNDSIWRYKKQNGEMIGDYLMILKEKGILHYYDKTKQHLYNKYNLFNKKYEYVVIKDLENRKIIQGFDCFFLKLIRKDPESDLGNTIYEMYVTNEIELPLHSVLNINEYLENTFPVEVKIFEGKLSGIAETIKLVSYQH